MQIDMGISYRNLEKLGITIDESKSPVIAYIPKDISKSTKHDLWLAFEGDILLQSVDEVSSSGNAERSSRDTQIFSEVVDYISETEFVKTAEVALTAHDENDAPIVRLFNTLLSAAITREASDLHIDPNNKDLLIRMRMDGVM
ncbi:MAG: hypothetical protein OSB34_10075, partial [Planktomarina sp.]|nr:hypothetical protein [Planktomarina sp.]